MKALDRLRNKTAAQQGFGTENPSFGTAPLGASPDSREPPRPRARRRVEEEEESTNSLIFHNSDDSEPGSKISIQAKNGGDISAKTPRGPCARCGQPVTWTNGLRNWFGEEVHLSCPTPDPGKPEDFSDLDEPEPPPFDDAAFAQTHRDFRGMAPEWRAAIRKRPSPDKRVYGLAENCPTCGGSDWWRSAVKPGPWNCRTCQPPNARRDDIVFRFATGLAKPFIGKYHLD
jgi:hypothetical protein